MPIPTRSISLREPRTSKPLTTGRSTTTKSIPSTTSTAVSGKSSHPYPGNENVSTRNKSLLPVRDDGRSALSSRIQQSVETRPSQRLIKTTEWGPQQQDEPSTREATGASRRQSLIRPSPLKPTGPVKPAARLTTPKQATFAIGPSSPTKQESDPRQDARPLSPKKSDLPLPSLRPSRSASLRQPVKTSLSAPPASRGHARHRSQGVTPNVSRFMGKLEPQSPVRTTPIRPKAQIASQPQALQSKKSVNLASKHATACASENGDTRTSSWPELSTLQIELLHLSLIHSSTLQQKSSWTADAAVQLRIDYNSVASDYRVALAVDQGYQSSLNGQALHCWFRNSNEHNGPRGFAAQVKVLSQVAEDMYSMADSLEGRYTVVVREFEEWFQQVQEIQHHRLHQGLGMPQDVFIESSDRAWKEEVSALSTRLDYCSRQLQSLDILGYGELEQLDSSALFRMTRNLEEMVNLMTEELQAIRKIEGEVVRAERAYVGQLARQLSDTPPPKQRLGLWKQASMQS
ncbi:uncharacterized protein BP01DRAFT_378615 [Aspergillus saccharolyticus JOP 1030-1]|uniref:Uncharacterized protein n=1 Tax=Aspergillus saccharolyticus JOP 1030-1 TaxID=1450539 RepID=A0A318ZR59_9EURO|nr:hypothetical protein BP01DRAFT_378615 [Aspergillus saccharolyticus JOP 1030-1]PYH50006.1 hypothetical protein BP01DRAFT_378615 [Aspergillus saccharolyticus JOP 1030-1]